MDEVGGRAETVARGLAAGVRRGDRRRPAAVFAQPRQTPTGPPSGRPLPAADELAQRRARAPMGPLHAARPSGGSVPYAQRRSRVAAHLAPDAATHRGPYLRRLPRLRPARDLAPAPERTGPGTDQPCFSGKAAGHPDGGRASANDRRTGAHLAALHPARSRGRPAARKISLLKGNWI